MKTILLTCVVILLSSCTYSINFAHSEGHASELINDADTPKPHIAPSFVLPPSPLRV